MWLVVVNPFLIKALALWWGLLVCDMTAILCQMDWGVVVGVVVPLGDEGAFGIVALWLF